MPNDEKKQTVIEADSLVSLFTRALRQQTTGIRLIEGKVVSQATAVGRLESSIEDLRSSSRSRSEHHDEKLDIAIDLLRDLRDDTRLAVRTLVDTQRQLGLQTVKLDELESSGRWTPTNVPLPPPPNWTPGWGTPVLPKAETEDKVELTRDGMSLTVRKRTLLDIAKIATPWLLAAGGWALHLFRK